MNLTARDLISVGIFTALYFAIVFIFAMVGFLGPLAMFVGFGIGIILDGIVVALFVVRTPKLGALTLLGGINGVLLVFSGQTWLVVPAGLIAGFLADLVVTRGDPARLPRRIPWAYAVLAMTTVVPLLPIAFDSQAYFASTAEQMGQDYADAFASLMQAWVLPAWTVISFGLGLTGGLLGVRVTRKHFERAGLA
ncbi:MptD family putative ECF transporter S component [Brevibacterium sediminis]|uniref:MptD family putative ECF transporter S component n=1 Tax=Brevibacterium sediminis TaxID=1857024 RepID=UPI002174E23D|nr:MptD family putative ECF transporter S component [Brevibacterium sediminis]MCS4592286.1 MptD family putative ECF transporter S component [Brevibacterium sediminis]